MTNLRDASVQWVYRALSEVLQSESDEVHTRAENLVAIAEEARIPIEQLVQWVYLTMPGKDHSSAEFRRYAAKYAAERAELLQLNADDPWRQLCPQCHSQVAHRLTNGWKCIRCGDVEVNVPVKGDDE